MTRSNDAMPDWNTFIIDATWVSGIENWREYWMNAWMPPMLILPLAYAQTAHDGHDHVLQVAHEHREGLHQARHELRTERRLVELVVGVAETLLDLALAPERFHDRVPGERLLDLGVEQAGVLPLGDELGPGARRDRAHAVDRDRHGGERHHCEHGRDGEHHHRAADEQQHRVSIWLNVCWRLCATLSMSLVTRLSRSPRDCLSM